MDDKLLCVIDDENRKLLVYDKSELAELRPVKNMISTMKSIFKDNVKIEWYNEAEIEARKQRGYTISNNMEIKISLL